MLSRRVLNRTLLQRQLLVERSSGTVLEAIQQLVAVQGQESNWPYVGLWTRLVDFQRDDLTSLLHDRRVVRAGLIRRTKHLVRSDDFRWLRPLVQPHFGRAPRQGSYGRETAGLDLAELAEVGRTLLAGQTLSVPQLGRLLAERFPGRDRTVLVGSLQFLVTVVHPPPSGTWGGWGTRGGTPFALAEDWLGQPMAPAPRVESLIRRYLASFGPASVADIQAWSGLTRLREAVDGLRSQLRVLSSEHGTELFDLPEAPIADPDLPAPVRFLPAYDNLLLGHADRTRVIADADRPAVMPGQAMVRPTFLVDGFVHGTWSWQDSEILIRPFRPLSKADATQVEQEAERLRAFLTCRPRSGPVSP
jgi:hypothetical protein